MNCMYRTLLAAVALAFSSVTASAETITVCADGCDYTSINAAINAASDGDVIQLAAETYFEGAQIDTLGKAITLRGVLDKAGEPASVLDGDGLHRGLICQSGETASTVFNGLVVQNSYAAGNGSKGGGMWNSNASSPRVVNCVFMNNAAQYGGGMCNEESSAPTLIDCTFTNNSAASNGGGTRGGGMYNIVATPTLTDCTFTGNSATGLFGAGGGMYNVNGNNVAMNGCGFFENSAAIGGGLVSNGASLADCTLCGNDSGQIFGGFTDMGGNCVAYSCDDADGDGTPDKCVGDGSMTLLVPSEYAQIEDAVEAAGYGDVVLVEAGVYFPSRTIDPGGKPITIRGAVDSAGQPAAIIDGGGVIRLLQCSSGESADTVFENLLIRNGYTISGGGGGGMYNLGSSPTLINCTFSFNSSVVDSFGNYGDGGGMYNNASSPSLANCAFVGNSADGDGGGMCNSGAESSPSLFRCVFESNAGGVGGGISSRSGANPFLQDCAFCENIGADISGNWVDDGGNCIACSCDDQDRDGFPDVCGREENQSDPLRVPSEYESIEAAIDAATCGDTIVIAAGVYFETRSVNSGGKAITIRGEVDSSGIPITVIDGGGLIRGLECVAGETDSTVFENLVIQNGLGQAESTYGGGVVAGGMFIFQSSPIVRNCMFRENQSAYGGGMILAYSNATLDGCAFEENASTGSAGGIGMNISNPTLVNCMFLANTSSSSGGGLLCNQQSNPNLTNCTFEGNIAGSSGGAMLNLGESAATLTDCLFTSNVAGVGGGIRNSQSSLNLIDCVFEANSATEQGGAISFEEDAGSQIEGCFFNLNRAIDAGDGIHLSGTVTLGVLMTACVFTECCQNLPIGFGADPELGNDLGWPCADCVGDVTCNAMVNAGDLGRLLSAWDTTQQRYDLNQDGIVDAADLGLLLGSWGVCE